MYATVILNIVSWQSVNNFLYAQDPQMGIASWSYEIIRDESYPWLVDYKLSISDGVC